MATPPERPSFYKLHPGDLFCNKLKIPRAFFQHFRGVIPHQCHLETAARTWLVDVEEVNNKFYFGKGWNKFSVDNSFKYGELLLFHYAGNANFHVDIFGKNGCLKLVETPDEDDHVSLEILDHSPSSTLQPHEIRTSRNGKPEMNSNLGERVPHPEMTRMKNKEAHWSSSEIKGNATDRAGTSRSRVCEGGKKHEHGDALERAELFKIKNPSSVLVSMKCSYLYYRFVWLPSEFTTLVRPHIGHSGNVVLRVSDRRVRTWRARITCEGSAGSNRTKIHAGWPLFVRENGLKLGDVCAFKVIRDIEVFVEVVIFRGESAEDCRSFADISDHDSDNEEGVDVEHDFDEEKEDEDEDEDDDEDDDEYEEEKEEEEEDDNFLPYSRTMGVASRFHKRKRNTIQDGGLSKDNKILKAKAIQEAYAFKADCDHLCFVVSLPATYANGNYMNFPRSFSRDYLTEQQPDLVTIRIKKNFWHINVNYIDKTVRLQCGWNEFVKANNLATGDACAFVWRNRNKFIFDVEIFRMSSVGNLPQGERNQPRSGSRQEVMTESQIDEVIVLD